MAGPLASLIIKLGLDVTDVQKNAAKAEDALGGITKGKALTALKAGIGVGLAAATKGALAMEDVSARFRAETGASAEEAKRFAEYVNDASGKTVLGMDQIADTATKVRTDMGLMGDEAERQTDLFLKYERATSQGADAVGAYDDILDAWNLTAADSQKIMDSLITSHQDYGGAITADQDALAKLAPVLRGANMSWEDGIALINASKEAGLDASETVSGLTKALDKVGSPEGLQKLVDDISAIEDPAERSQAAIDAFGARGGLKLAQALSHGGLDAYRQDLDDVAGATERAADALDDTWTNKIRKALNYANSLITGFAMNLGPLLTGAMSGVSLLGALGVDRAALGKFGGVLKAALKSGLARVGLEGVGGSIAAKLSKGLAAKLGGALAAVGIGVIIGEAIAGPAVEAATKDATAKISAAVGNMVTDEDLDAARAKLVQAQKDISGAVFGLGSVIDFGTRDALQAQIDAIDAKKAALRSSAEDAAGAVADGIDAGSIKARRAAHGVSDAFGALDLGDLKVDANGVKRSFAEVRTAMISGLGGAVQAAESGMAAIQTALAKPPKLISMKKRMAMFGKAARQAWKNMRAAVKADDPVNAAYWESQYLNVRDEQKRLRGSTTKTMAEIRRDMKAAGVAIPQGVRKGVRQARASVATLGKMDATSWGYHLGTTFAAGIKSSIPAARTAAFGVAGAVAGGLKFSSPPKHGPLSTIRSWGPHMLEQWARPTEGALGRVERTASAWAKAATPSMGSRWQPAAAYAGGSRASRLSRGTRSEGGDHFHIGTLIANDAGVDELHRRMDRRTRLRRRDRRVYDSPNAQER